MMKHLKRLSALLVALAIFFTAIPTSAFYEDEEAVTLTEEQETDYSLTENDVVSFELLILPQYESGTTYSFTYDGFGRTTSTKVGNRTLSTYTYNSKGLTSSMNYGNGVTVSYGYDALNRQTEFYVNGTLRYNYRYDGLSRLSELTDLLLGRTTRYEYDILGRLTGEKLINNTNGTILSKLSLRYDDSKNRLAGYDVTIGGTTNSTDYVYGGNTVAPDLITGVDLNGIRKISYTYDGLNRLSVRNLNNYFTEYTYLQGATSNSTTTLVSSMKNGNDTLSYTYDELGNITSISKNGTVIESYTYDNLNQIKTVTRGNDVYTYNYDNGGNILSVTKNGQNVKTYTYGDSEWKDLLTAYNGQTITYDNIGNPLTYYNGSTFTWSDGRKLTNIVNGTDNISYTYDSNGLRASKNVNGTVTEYYWLDGTLYAEKTGNQYIYFHYDDNGIAYGFTVNDGSTTTDYYYIHNLQGDVIGILDSNGTKVVEYTYDEWGKLLATTGTLASTIGAINPIRYRGYYYDTETGFYYCRARYYDPEICRWINVDGYISTGQGMLGNNMYAYCGNNPVNLKDNTGEIAISATLGGIALWKIGVAVFGVIGSYIIADAIVKNPPTVPSLSPPKQKTKQKEEAEAKEKDITKTKTKEQTIIYRYGGTNPGNLTPKQKDATSGLSFSTLPPPPGVPAAVTTIEALNLTGLVVAVQDSLTHVSVTPVGATTQDWIDAGSGSIWTVAVQSTVVKWEVDS